MLKPIFTALAALLAGCEASLPPPPPPQPVVAVAAAADPADVPFRGTYPKQAVSSFENGRRIKVVNEGATGSLRITAGKVTFEQTYDARGETRHVVQVYTFAPVDIAPAGDDGYDVKLAFQSIEGQGPTYSPDSGNPTLLVRKRAFGWEITFVALDRVGVLAGVTFGAAPPDQPDVETLAYARRAGLLPAGSPIDLTAPPDVGGAPPDAAFTASGLASKMLSAGTGQTHPGPTDLVKVHYTGWKANGEMFDSSVMRGTPASFRLNQVIKGWTEGVQLMVAGEKRRLWLPADLAYGTVPRAGMPTGDLVFDIELIELTPSATTPPTPPDVGAPPASAKRTRSGLAYRLLRKGTGKRSPKANDTVVVTYSGWTNDGKLFDSSVTRGAPETFRLDTVIKGWTEGVQLMKVGDVARFWMPADLAYGTTPRAGAPAGTLVFDIELHEIK